MADRYAVTVGGNSNVVGTWSATSGGAGGASVPVATDNVFLDLLSGNLALVGAFTCANFDCTGYLGTLSGTGTMAVTGDTFKLSATMTTTNTGTLTCSGANAVGDVTLTFAGRTVSHQLAFNGSGKTFKLADAVASGSITLTNGTFISQGFSISCVNMTLSAGTLDISGSTVVATSNIFVTAGVFVATGCTINGTGNFSSSNTNARTITLTGATLEIGGSFAVDSTNLTWSEPNSITVRLQVGPGATMVAGGVTIPLLNINLNGASVARYGGQFINTGGTLVINELAFIGTPDANTGSMVFTLGSDVTIDKANFPTGVYLLSNVNGTQRTITTTTDELTATGDTFKDIVVSGGPLIAIDSVDAGNNSGISFQSFGPDTHSVTGATKDDAGAALGSCDVFLLKRVGDELIQADFAVSDGTTGAYTLGAPDNDPDYVLVSTKGTPDRGDAMTGIVPI